MIALSDRPAVLRAIDGASSVRLAAYILPASVTRHLTAAARRGARVELALAQYPVGADASERWAMADANRAAVRAVRYAGGAAELVPPRDPLHLKAVLVDERVAYLDDRNWSDDGPQTILCDDEPADVDAVRGAFDRRPTADAHFATVKPRSLALECDVIEAAGGAALDVESESFGIGPVYDALSARAAQGAPTRLLVASRELLEAQVRAAAGARRPAELTALDDLAIAGVDIRVTDAAEKMAVGPVDAWLGSTNATRDWGSTATQLDWGMRVGPAIAPLLRERFRATWDAAVGYGVGDRAAAS